MDHCSIWTMVEWTMVVRTMAGSIDHSSTDHGSMDHGTAVSCTLDHVHCTLYSDAQIFQFQITDKSVRKLGGPWNPFIPQMSPFLTHFHQF